MPSTEIGLPAEPVSSRTPRAITQRITHPELRRVRTKHGLPDAPVEQIQECKKGDSKGQHKSQEDPGLQRLGVPQSTSGGTGVEKVEDLVLQQEPGEKARAKAQVKPNQTRRRKEESCHQEGQQVWKRKTAVSEQPKPNQLAALLPNCMKALSHPHGVQS